MVVSIHQPEHLPWMGLIHKISVSDTHIALDNVQFKKNYFENRNKIYTHQGWKWLTLPVQMRGHIEKKFYEMELMSGWKKKYLETLKITYKKAPFYKDIESIVQLIQDYEGFNLAEINLNIIEEICKKLDIHTRILRAKDMHVSGKKTELLIEILLNVKATSYLVGNSGFDYMDLSLFQDHNISLIPHKFNHPVYTPFNFPSMTDFPSVIDVLANLGTQNLKNTLK